MPLCSFAYQELESLGHSLLRVNPTIRDGFDRLFREPNEAITQALINLGRRRENLAIAEERLLPDEPAIAQAIAREMGDFLKSHYLRGGYQRAGNTKTHGVVRAVFEVMPGLAKHLAIGLFAEPRSYRAWVRFAGPGPFAPADPDDNGILSIGIKVMGGRVRSFWTTNAKLRISPASARQPSLRPMRSRILSCNSKSDVARLCCTS